MIQLKFKRDEWPEMAALVQSHGDSISRVDKQRPTTRTSSVYLYIRVIGIFTNVAYKPGHAHSPAWYAFAAPAFPVQYRYRYRLHYLHRPIRAQKSLFFVVEYDNCWIQTIVRAERILSRH
jgi:hypothetical protein